MVERMRPLISQALVNSAIWGETNLPVSNSVRNEVLMKAVREQPLPAPRPSL